MIKKIAKDFFIKWQQACYVCFPMMVQGNLFALTFDHWIKANKTGKERKRACMTRHYCCQYSPGKNECGRQIQTTCEKYDC